jgi:hypothetical protein
MTVYEIHYPFEVDEERGSMSVLYPTIRSALKDAAELYQRRAQDEEGGRFGEDPDLKSTMTAQVERAKISNVTPGLLCAIINSQGEGWCAKSEMIGQIVWRNQRARFIKTSE